MIGFLMQALKPRLPLKLFKAPGSFNYKRLMDVIGDNFGNYRKFFIIWLFA